MYYAILWWTGNMKGFIKFMEKVTLKIKFMGLAYALGCHMWYQHPRWVLRGVLAALLPVRLPANVAWESSRNDSRSCASVCHLAEPNGVSGSLASPDCMSIWGTSLKVGRLFLSVTLPYNKLCLFVLVIRLFCCKKKRERTCIHVS